MANKDFIYIEGSQFRLNGEWFPLKAVNYYPSRNSWRRMWEAWDSLTINAELGMLEDIGVNTVRIFLDYHLFEKNRIAGDASIMLARLEELIGICSSHGMRALVTLCVWGRGKIATDKLHVRHIVERYANDPRVFAWDISNELDHGAHDVPSLQPEIRSWAAAIFAEVKAIDPNHLVTVGDYGHYLGSRDDPYGSGISLDISKMTVPIETQDFVCFHWYSHYYALEKALTKLREATGKPILIEELGLPSGGIDDQGAPWYLNEQQVAGYLAAWMDVCAFDVASDRGAYIMPWCGFDYVGGLSPFRADCPENFYGLYDVNYRLKPAGEVFRGDPKAGISGLFASHTLPELKKIDRREIHYVVR